MGAISSRPSRKTPSGFPMFRLVSFSSICLPAGVSSSSTSHPWSPVPRWASAWATCEPSIAVSQRTVESTETFSRNSSRPTVLTNSMASSSSLIPGIWISSRSLLGEVTTAGRVPFRSRRFCNTWLVRSRSPESTGAAPSGISCTWIKTPGSLWRACSLARSELRKEAKLATENTAMRRTSNDFFTRCRSLPRSRYLRQSRATGFSRDC